MSILLGILSAFAWGTADFLARLAARQVGNYRTLLYMQPFGLFGLSLWLLLENRVVLDWPAVGLAALLAVSNTLAGLALYRAFEVGLLSIVAPVASSYSALTLVLGLLSGQRPGAVQLAGLVVTITGVALASAGPGGSPTEKGRLAGAGVGLALLAAAGFGLMFWGLGYVTPSLGSLMPVWEFRLLGPLVVLAVALPLRRDVSLPPRSAWLWIAGVGILDTSAYVLFTLGLRGAESGVVAVLSSLFSAVSVLLARLFLDERLAARQWAGIALILLGIGLVSGGQPA